jgi:hypothetical protein
MENNTTEISTTEINNIEISNINIGVIILLLFIICCIIIIIYGYNSGSCKINKKYICETEFCLYKMFKIILADNIKNEIYELLSNNQIKKRVNIELYPEKILNCAVPNKKGITISTNHIVKYAGELINYYQNDLCKLVSEKINLKLYPTDLELPTTCAILIYDNEGDWINWHYDYNYYEGRFFTLLIPITNNLTCTEFQFMDDSGKITSMQLVDNNCICFEGNFLFHRASKLCKGQKRILLSCQYVTDNNMSMINKLRLRLKDFAYTGKLF